MVIMDGMKPQSGVAAGRMGLLTSSEVGRYEVMAETHDQMKLGGPVEDRAEVLTKAEALQRTAG